MEGHGDEEQKKVANDIKKGEEEWVLGISTSFYNMLKNEAISDQDVEYMNQATFTEEENELMHAEAMAMAKSWCNAMPIEKGDPLVYKDDRIFFAECGGQNVRAVEFKPFKFKSNDDT